MAVDGSGTIVDKSVKTGFPLKGFPELPKVIHIFHRRKETDGIGDSATFPLLHRSYYYDWIYIIISGVPEKDPYRTRQRTRTDVLIQSILFRP